ncbi:hypothetical protein AVEN_55070-1 [Araneus ventricosus]|uniref:RNase H type-1 domain-containing protein n=1 Tax=Araneus ventricosus TaxID=182803 RepID=A0A4Y2GTT5_ARAVE|nr:hypothetical protein AVEN_55070-1 [Araneus ventricosus]
MVREIQTLLLSHKHIHLRWLKAHVGYLGNECADQLAREAITKGDPFFLPKPLAYLKSEDMGPYLHTFNLRTHDNCSCGEKGDPMHYATKCPLTLSWHFQTPAVPLKLQWLKNILMNSLSRT